MKTSMEVYTILLLCFSLSSFSILSTATDTINLSQSLREGDTIVSAGGIFEFGFFTPDSVKHYVGIWYKKISTGTVVWAANRETPLLDSSGVLKFTNQGNLAIFSHNETIIWSSNSSTSAPINPVAQLLDSGNLVVRDKGNDDNPENLLWQSFDYPGDTFLPGMKLGRNMTTGQEWYLSSWKSTDNPSQGNYTYRLDRGGYPQLLIRKGSAVQFNSGPWNGLRFSGFANYQTPNPVYIIHFVLNQKEIYYTNEVVDSSLFMRLVLNQNGLIQRYLWVDRTQVWNLYRTGPQDVCDSFALCGAYGSCNIANSPECECLKRFVPEDAANGSSRCVRRTPLNCSSGDGFIKYSGLKLPDTRFSWFNESMNLDDCKMVCLKNCSCMAYASLNISTGGSGCLLWFDDLIDIRVFTENGQEIYIRMASSELVGSNMKKRVTITVGLVLAAGILLLVLGLYVWRKKKLSKQGKKGLNQEGYTTEDQELPLFDLATVTNATNNFSIKTKLGHGGFGTVYKGVLKDGKEIAVKRLSKNSTQGLDEFKNEVKHVNKLQHRNLVKLLGCCIQVDETMLIYEFMPNKSLDFFIFDHTKSIILDSPKRFHIINGIAQGLLYLHRDSRLRIIHRDLKAGNILLDKEMNPKISDFGLSRSFGG